MHSDMPWLVGGMIKEVVHELIKKPPKFIVDSGKFHFPYFDHPNFDLWPRWSVQAKERFDLRHHPRQPVDAGRRVTLKEVRDNAGLYDWQVEDRSYKLLIEPRRKGGAIPEDQAKEMAGAEVERHRSMSILREFVMSNYEPDRSLGGINIYRLKE
jgi:hypothetical protein